MLSFWREDKLFQVTKITSSTDLDKLHLKFCLCVDVSVNLTKETDRRGEKF